MSLWLTIAAYLVIALGTCRFAYWWERRGYAPDDGSAAWRNRRADHLVWGTLCGLFWPLFWASGALVGLFRLSTLGIDRKHP
jgi:hypothetical protein